MLAEETKDPALKPCIDALLISLDVHEVIKQEIIRTEKAFLIRLSILFTPH